METQKIKIDETFGIKQDALVEGFTKVLQTILLSKQNFWSLGGRPIDDFFISHPSKQFNPDEKAKIHTKDIYQWDMTLCSKWLTDFKWDDAEKLTKDQKAAVRKLKEIRNKTNHLAAKDQVSKQEFEENCTTCRANLCHFVSKEIIEKIIKDASDKVLSDRKKIFEMGQTHWDYTTKAILGSGNFGIVVSIDEILDGSESALKIIPIKGSKDIDDKTLREVRNLEKLNQFQHPNVVRYKASDEFKLTSDTFKSILLWDTDFYEKNQLEKPDFIYSVLSETNENEYIKGLYIKTEVCGETLRHWLEADHPYIDAEAPRICQDLINGLNYVHAKKVIHRDLRPDNIFFAKDGFTFPIKIGDFGLSTEIEACNSFASRTNQIGHFLYSAPEMNVSFKNQSKASTKYDKNIDLFSLGLIISEILDPTSVTQINDKFGRIKFNMDTGEKIRSNYPLMNEMILRLTNRDPNLRGNLHSIKETDLWGRPITPSIEKYNVEQISQEMRMTQVSSPLEMTYDLSGGQTVSLIASQPLPVPSGSRYEVLNERGGELVLKESSIVDIKKIFLKSKRWTLENVEMFLNKLDPTVQHVIKSEGLLKKQYNHYMYRMRESGLLSKAKIIMALTGAGIPKSSESLANIEFEEMAAK